MLHDPARPVGPGCVLVMPALNEAAHIHAAMTDLVAGGHGYPILVMDGGSTDGTQDIVRQFSADHTSVRLEENLGRLQSRAVNKGADIAWALGARTMIRVDAHARYPIGFVSGLIATLDARQSDSVVVPLVANSKATGASDWARASGLLQMHWLGTGGSPHRTNRGTGRWVRHGHHAAFRLAAFRAVGGYDPDFVANEDAEFDLRLIGAGGRIYLDPNCPVTYIPRTDPAAIFKQFLRNGRWRVTTARKHGTFLGPRQLVPLGAVLGVFGSGLSGVLLNPWLGLPAMAYFGTVASVAQMAARPHLRLGPKVALLAIAMHAGFGLGVLSAIGTGPRIKPPEVEVA